MAHFYSPNSIEKDEVTFQRTISCELPIVEKAYERANRVKEAECQIKEADDAASGVWANDRNIMIRSRDLSPERNTNCLEQCKSFGSGANLFCTDRDSSIWQQCRSPQAGKSQREFVWARVNSGSNMSQTTESTREERFEWDTFLSPFSSAAHVLQTPERSKEGPDKSPHGFMCPSTPVSSLSSFNEKLSYSPPLGDIDFNLSLPIENLGLWLSPVPVFHNGHFLEEGHSLRRNGSWKNLNDSWNEQDVRLRSGFKLDHSHLYPSPDVEISHMNLPDIGGRYFGNDFNGMV